MTLSGLHLAALALSLAAAPASAAILEVGAGKTYGTIAAAASAARDGDTIHIFAGTYTRGAVFQADNLTIMAAPGTPKGKVIVKTGIVNGKGLFDIKGDNNVVDNIRFNYAKATDGNGAGIRAEGKGLIVRNSVFYKNEMGILITPFAEEQRGGTYTVTGSTFDYTKSNVSGRIGHGIYATERTGELIVEGSTFKRGAVGHYVKSRAPLTTVRNNTIDDTSGSASYLIELPEGGAATIANNTLVKGANAANCCTAISYGAEMYKGGAYVNAPGPVVISGNSFTNKRNSTVRFVDNRSAPANPVTLVGNSLVAAAGSIVALQGPGTVAGVAQLVPLIGALGFDDYLAASAADFTFRGEGPAAAAVATPAALPLLLGGSLLLAAARRRRRA